MTILLYVVGLLLILGGIAGLLLPAVPGAPLIFLGLLAVSWADGFTRIGWPGLAVLGVLTAVISAVDYLAGLLGARRFGASRWGVAGAALGLLAGLFFGLPGLVLGPLAGALLLEYLKDPDLPRAARAGLGTLVGFVVGTVLKYTLALFLLGLAVALYVIP